MCTMYFFGRFFSPAPRISTLGQIESDSFILMVFTNTKSIVSSLFITTKGSRKDSRMVTKCWKMVLSHSTLNIYQETERLGDTPLICLSQLGTSFEKHL